MTISKAQAQLIIDELQPIIKATLERHGLDASNLKWNYGDYFGLKLQATEVNKGLNGVNMSSQEARYFTNFGFSGVTAPLGTKFTHKGTEYVFAGIAAKRHKYPIYTVRAADGAGTFFPEGIIPTLNKAAMATA